MINFEEELKKFHPSMEVDEVQDAVFDHDLTDMTDIMLSIMRQAKERKESRGLHYTIDYPPKPKNEDDLKL